VDAQGRRAGKDPSTGTLYKEIPDTSYEEDFVSAGHGSALLNFSAPPNGKYILYVLGEETGPYRLDSWVDDGGVKPPLPQRISGSIQEGSTIGYIENYDAANIPSSTLSSSSTFSSTVSITSAPPQNVP
jgi:hypothetical protein